MATKMEMFREMTQAMREERESSSNANYRNDETFWYGSKLNRTPKHRVEAMLVKYRAKRQEILKGYRPLCDNYGKYVNDEGWQLRRLEHICLTGM